MKLGANRPGGPYLGRRVVRALPRAPCRAPGRTWYAPSSLRPPPHRTTLPPRSSHRASSLTRLRLCAWRDVTSSAHYSAMRPRMQDAPCGAWSNTVLLKMHGSTARHAYLARARTCGTARLGKSRCKAAQLRHQAAPRHHAKAECGGRTAAACAARTVRGVRLIAADADIRRKAALRQAIDLSVDLAVGRKLQIAPARGLRI